MMCKKSKGGRNMKKYVRDVTYILQAWMNSCSYVQGSNIKRSITEKSPTDKTNRAVYLVYTHSDIACAQSFNENYNNLPA